MAGTVKEDAMRQPKDNAAYLRKWATDIRKYSGKSVDADRCDAIADEIERLRKAVKMLGDSSDVCTHFVTNEICKGCRCHRNPERNAELTALIVGSL